MMGLWMLLFSSGSQPSVLRDKPTRHSAQNVMFQSDYTHPRVV